MPGIDVLVKDKIDAGINRKLSQMTRQSNSAASAIERLNTAMSSMNRTTGLGSASGAMANFGRATSTTQRSFKSFVNDLGSAEGRFNALTSSVMEGVRGLRSLLGAIFVVSLNLAAIERIDTFKSMQNQLRMTTDSTEQLNSVTAQLFGVAERARVPVESLIRSFRRFDAAMAKMGKSQGDSIRMTETVGKMLTLAGANANESASALLQLSQAFNKGKLDGDEFRSVAELMPQVLDAMAKHLEVNRGELFKLSRQGQLTARALTDALLGVSDEVDAAMAGLPRTVGNSITNLMNKILLEFGKFDMASSITDRIVAAFDAIGNNLPSVIDGIQGVTAALLVLASPAIAAFFATASKFFLNVPGMIAVGIGLFAAFADKIRVSGSETATLTDRMTALYDLFKEDVTTPQINGVSKLQAAWDGIASTIEFFVKEWGIFMAEIAALVATLEQIGFGGWMEALGDGIQKVAKIIDTGLIDGLIRMAEVGDKAITAIANTLQAVLLDPFNEFLAKIGSFVDTFDKSIASKPIKALLPDRYLNDLSAELKKGIQVGGGFDSGFIEYLKSLKVEMGNTGQKWDAMMQTFDAVQAETVKAMTDRHNNFLQQLEDRTEENAQKRIETEEKVRDAFTEKPELNRGADYDLMRHDQILAYKDAVEKAAQSHALLGQAIQANGPFAEGFVRQLIEEQTALQGFKSELELSKIALSDLIQGWQDDPKFAEPIRQAEEQIRLLNEGAQNMAPAMEAVNQSATAIPQAISGIDAAVSTADSAIQNMQSTVDSTSASVSAMSEDAVTSLSDLDGAAYTTSDAVGSTLSSSFDTAAMSAASFIDSTVAGLNQVTDAAYEAAAAVSSIGSGGGGGGGGGFGGGWFSKGGYTGDMPTNAIAGVVHGQEFVMPAAATRQYRPLLEAMRSGSVGTGSAAGAAASIGSSGSGAMTVSVHNYGSSKISVQQLSANEIRIIAREESTKAVQSQTPELVASHLRNPNSKVSKSIAANTNAQRRR